ncbi:cysteine desulfurase family protein [Dongia sp.]|uniref:cysteine desulfurase family protein n=1 Tax=Dongia sp. TaxID=1977262 RepID=UPI0035B33B74
MNRGVYMDWNATAPLRAGALATMAAVLQEVGNPSSVHAFGRRARAWVDHARDAVAKLVGGRAALVTFTSGGTEANNLALHARQGRTLVVSAIEHESVLRPARIAGAQIARVGRNGEIDVAHLAYLIDKADRPAFVSVMLANNETGVIQPVAEIARIAKSKGALVHCDAVQAAGRVPVDISELGVDYLTLSAHKIGGPQGAGALVLAGDLPVEPLVQGGGQERNRRGGTENVAAIAGFGAAADEATQLGDNARIAILRDALEERLVGFGLPLTVFGRTAMRLPNTSCFASGTKTAETLVMALDLAGIAISAGSACSSGKVRPSHVISAMGFDAATAGSAIRVSLGWQNSQNDIDQFVGAWGRVQRIGLSAGPDTGLARGDADDARIPA